jgi:murein L,D-transpeptidase YafK
VPPVATTVPPKPTPAPTPLADAGAEHDVEAAVKAWAAAWSKQDMDAYFASYSKEFNGGKSRKAWEQERRDRITGKRSISVKISGIKVDVNGNKATARFHQDYKADSLSVSSGKRLDLVRSGGSWVIVKESAGS